MAAFMRHSYNTFIHKSQTHSQWQRATKQGHRDQLCFFVLLKDISTHGWEELVIKLPTLWSVISGALPPESQLIASCEMPGSLVKLLCISYQYYILRRAATDKKYYWAIWQLFSLLNNKLFGLWNVSKTILIFTNLSPKTFAALVCHIWQ